MSSVTSDEEVLSRILERVREARNFDFRKYKRATVRRRIERRRLERKCATLEEYAAILDGDANEVDHLVSTLLIKVSSFFRDPEVWDALRTRIIPALIAARRPTDELRIWCAGCATGEEAYSVALLLADLLGPAFSKFPAKVFGTDLDETAIATARRGVYPNEAVSAVPPEMLARWTVAADGGVAVKKELRRILVFGVNDLVSDAPISRLDLLICRNVFIYLEGGLQKKILARFHYAMRPHGILMLGKSELIPFAGRIFHPVDLQRRLYRKEIRDEQGPRIHKRVSETFAGEASKVVDESHEESSLSQRSGDVLNSLGFPIIGTAPDGSITLWSKAAAKLWNRNPTDVIGRKLAELELTGLNGDILVDKTALVRQGRSERESTDNVISTSSVRNMGVTIEVSALKNADGRVEGLLYTVQDVSAFRALELNLRHANEERQSANEELQTTNEELQSANEELETTNEELQSANEELQTTNEELQSTNEELETTNEELQSTNAELDTTNRELAHRTEELHMVSFNQRTIIRSLSAAVVVLDADGRIGTWNLAAERLLGLPEGEAIGQLIWPLRIPALRRSQMQRIRKSLAEKLATRIDNVTYDFPSGGRGWGTLAAIPILEGDGYLGAVLIFEDSTRAAVLAKEVKEMKARTVDAGKNEKAKPRRRAR